MAPLFWLVCIGLLLQACVGPAVRVLDDLDIPPEVDLVDTPFYPQEAYQCGPAALATILGPAGVEVAPDTLKPLVYLPEREGSLQAEMLVAPAAYGLAGVQVPGRLAALLELLASGYPVLVLQNLGTAALPVWHYAVLVGYDLPRRRVILRSGIRERELVSLNRFEKTWDRAGRWAMLVLPPGILPGPVEPLAYLQAASALERSGQAVAAARLYEAATRRWEDNALAWAGAGNSAYTSGDYVAAERAYRRALALQDNPLVMNNLAMALAGQGCRAQALAVVDCGLARRPGDTLLTSTQAEISQMPAGAARCKRFSCPVPTP